MTIFCSRLKRSGLVILLINIFFAFTQTAHEITYIVGCFDNSSTEVQLEFDSDEDFYVDFEKGRVEYTGLNNSGFDPTQIFQDLHIYLNALRNRKTCTAVVAYATALEKESTEKTDSPESILYTAEEVERGVENSLICFVNHFYPPFIKVTWTKNDQPVSEGVSLSRYFPNKDQTFHQFSTLKFTPTETDIYSCTVEHMALDRPQTRIWEPYFQHQSFEVDVFFALSLSLGLLGVAAGTYFIVKGLQRN